MQEKAMIAMSGGVDSSVAALLMKRNGFACVGATMHLYDNEEIGKGDSEEDTAEGLHKTCCTLDDASDAASVCRRLQMRHYVFNFRDSFRCQVMQRFVDSYCAGRTPNPCIDCNRCLKFDAFWQRAKELGCSKIATGHYARIDRDENGRFRLRKAADENKDQSYVLYCLTQEQLSATCFPLGELTKEEVRQIAEENGFVNARKHDSQDICFVPDGDYASFIERFTGKSFPQGEFVDKAGRVLGTHKGLIHYTIGQRKGLGVSYTSPLYVLGMDREKNRVVLGANEELFTRELTASEVNWVSVPEPGEPVSCLAKIRYRHIPQPATVYPLEGNRIRVVFDEPQRAITAGQAVVLYDGEYVLGGGTIDRNGPCV